MMRIGNEQANALRSALKTQAAHTQRNAARDAALYDEISRLNNELGVMQRELARKNAELERLSELKNRFLGIAAHDLRIPLNAIHGYAEFLRAGYSGRLSEAQRDEFLDVILSSSRFMAQLVDDLLDVARIESGKLHLELAPVNLAALAQRSVQVNGILAAQKEITIDLQAPADLPNIVGDPGKLEQVFNNLLSNAVKFSYAGSRVLVVLTAAVEEVRVRVADEGRGMTSEQLARLFRPYETRGTQGTAGEKSTGLGLVIVRKIVEGHGGAIEVQSQPGQGTVVSLRLPLQERFATADRRTDEEAGRG